MTIVRARVPVPFQGKENMTVQECVKFIMSFWGFRRVPSRWLFVGTREARLCVDSNAWY